MSANAEAIARMPDESINTSDANFRTLLETATAEFLRLLELEAGIIAPGMDTTPCTDRPLTIRPPVPVGGSSAWF